jgi:hypothetical protein
METVKIKLTQLEPNRGQVKGLPKNPRKVDEAAMKKLMDSIQQDPELLELRSLMVYEYAKGKYVVIGGNMRLEALRKMGFNDAPCVVVPSDTPVEKLRNYALKDNGSYGHWDFDLLELDWGIEEVQAAAIEFPSQDTSVDVSPDDFGDDFKLPDGEKGNVQVMSFSFVNEQAEFIKEQLKIAQYDNEDMFGNQNSNSNAIYSIVKQWADAKI